MNTEARVLATLNKIKEVQSKRKFGAIEDAINDAMSNADTYVKSMKSTYLEIEDAIANTLDAISSEIENISNLRAELKDQYISDYDAFKEINDELLDNNIEGSQFNDDAVNEMTGNFDRMLADIDRLTSFSASNY